MPENNRFFGGFKRMRGCIAHDFFSLWHLKTRFTNAKNTIFLIIKTISYEGTSTAVVNLVDRKMTDFNERNFLIS